MMIKGSLLCSIHIVKRFWQKFSKSKIGPKNWGFVGFRRGKILTLTMRPPRKSIPTETRHLTQKTVSIRAKMWSPEAGKKSYKK